MRKSILFVVVPLVLLVVGWVVHGLTRNDRSLIEGTLDRMDQAFRDQDADGIVDELHREYDIARHWGRRWATLAGADPADNRDEARRGIARLMFLERETEHGITYQIHSMEPVDDDRVAAIISLEVTPPYRAIPAQVQRLSEHRFVFARTGNLRPRMAIIDHDPITETGRGTP